MPHDATANVLETPDLDRTIAQMNARFEAFDIAEDRRARFLLMYRTFKQELRSNLHAGRFADPVWSEAICCRMGEMYFEADAAYRQDRATCPEPWSYAFDAAVGRRMHLVQDMLLGMNAHINYDLPFCTYDTMVRFGDLERARGGPGRAKLTLDATIRRRYHDFLLINQIAWESIPLIQDLVTTRFSRFLRWSNALMPRLTRQIAERIICDYRDRAWGYALLLATAKEPDERERVSRSATQFAMETAGLVDRLTLNPLKHLRAARRDRALEQGLAEQEDLIFYLVSKLKLPTTRGTARRVLEGYGAAVHPTLLRALDAHQADPRLRLELVRILGCTPEADTLEALAERVTPSEGAAYDHLLSVLARARMDGVFFDTDAERLHTALAREAAQATRWYETLHAFRSSPRAALLEDVLRLRLQRSLQRVARLLVVKRGDPRALEALHALDHSLRPPEETWPSVRTLLPPIHRTAAAPDPPDKEALLERLRRDEDPWVRISTACAADSTDEAERILHTILTAPDAPDQRLPHTMLSTIEKLLYLKNVRLFREIASEDLASLASRAEEQMFEPDAVLLQEGLPGEALLVVIEGEVRVEARGQELARVGEGAVLGEMSLLTGDACAATCTTLCATRALRIRQDDFLTYLLDYPEVSLGIIHVLAHRLRAMNQQAAQLTDA